MAALALSVVLAVALALASCGGDDEEPATTSETDELFTTTPEGTVTSEQLDRFLAKFDKACPTGETDADPCVAFMEANCGEGGDAPEIFCNTVWSEIQEDQAAVAAKAKKAAEKAEKAEKGQGETGRTAASYAVGEIARGEVVNGAQADGKIVELTVDIGADEVDADVPPGVYLEGFGPNVKVYSLSLIAGRKVEIERTDSGWVFVGEVN